MKFYDYCHRVRCSSSDDGNLLESSSQLCRSVTFEAKKLFVLSHVKQLYAKGDPGNLWASVVKHRLRQADDKATNDLEAECVSFDDLRLTYEGYRRVAYEVLFGCSPGDDEGDKKLTAWRREVYFSHPYLSPETFLQFERDADKCKSVAAVPLYAFVAKRLLLFRLRVELELKGSSPPPFPYLRSMQTTPSQHVAQQQGLRCMPSVSSPSSSSLTQEDLEAFIAEMLPNLRLVRDMPPWMMPYYLCHASRKFFFMCDSRGGGTLSIDSLMKSDVFSELLRMYENDPRDATVTFPVGCVVEVSKEHAPGGTATDARQQQADEEELMQAVVISFQHDGNCLNDMYTLECRGGGGGADARQPQRFDVPRRQLYWCQDTSASLSPEILAVDNWFSLPLMYRIYQHFTQLDVDADGVLTELEFAKYSNASYTPLTVHRVFDCYVPRTDGQQLMDYKGYLNFVVATEHPHAEASMKFLWRLLDLNDTRHMIPVDVMRCFTKEISTSLVSSGLMPNSAHISSQSILSEVIDMINPRWHEWITLEDIRESKQHATVLLILLNYKSFYAYDCREQTAATAADFV